MTVEVSDAALQDSAQKAASDGIVPNRWERFLAGQCPCRGCACCLFFGLGWLFTFILLGKLRQEGTDIFSFESNDVKADLIVQQYYAFDEARGEERGCNDDAHREKRVCEADKTCEWDPTASSTGGGRRGGNAGESPSKCKTKQLCPSLPARMRERPLVYGNSPAWVTVIYEAEDGGNILDDGMLEYIRKFEKELLTTMNGVQRKDGEASPWNQDWCRYTYPVGPRNATGRCAAPMSVTNLFAMTSEGRQKTKEQVQAGFSFGGPALACLCSDEDALCSVCTADGKLKGLNPVTGEMNFSQWPAEVAQCLLTSFSRTAPTTTPEPGMNAMCATQSSMSMAAAGGWLNSFCKAKPSCQWAPPMVSFACSSTALYHATDITQGLAKGDEKRVALEKMCDESNVGWWTVRRGQLALSFDCKTKATPFARISFFAGGEGSDGEGDVFENEYVLGRQGWYAKEQALEMQIEKESDGKIRMMLFSAVTIRSQYLSILLVDGVLSVVSLILVWAYMWWTLESLFLASMAMFEIIFSIPVAFFVWTVIFQQKIDFFQVLTLYMILGIGADDAFIFYDAWQQSRFTEVSGDFVKRFSWAYRRSAKAMAITTATTCGSFVIGAASPLPQVQAFCVFAALVVFVDWIFCITLFASAVVVYENFMVTTSEPGECCGPGCCFGFIRCFCVQKLGCFKSCIQLGGRQDPPSKRPMEKFCEGPVFNGLNHARWCLIAFWVAVIIAMASVAGTLLRTAEKPSPLGRKGLDAIRGFEILNEEFSVFGVPTTSFVYGLDPVEPVAQWSSTSAAEAVKYSADEAAKIVAPEGQMAMLSLCRAADLGLDDLATRCEDRKCLVLGKSSRGRCAASSSMLNMQGVYMPDDLRCENGRYCFMEDFAVYWAHYVAGVGCRNLTAPACAAEPQCSFDVELMTCHTTKTEYDYSGLPAAEFISILGSEQYAAYQATRKEMLRAAGREYDVLLGNRLTGYRLTPDRSAMEFAWVSFNATYPTQNTVEQANTWYDRWSAFQTNHAASIGGFHTTDLYKFMVTQNEMVKAAVMGVLLSLVITFVVLVLATWNWWISLLGLVNIVGIAIVFLGIIPIIGWSLGENECIFLIAVVGLSVDYSVHLLHAYHHGSTDDRKGRTQHSLSEMGISVLNSAVTTLLAAFILFFCGFYFFIQFGAFIFIVIALSIIMSITFLVPLLVVAGPEGDRGFLPRCWRSGKSSA